MLHLHGKDRPTVFKAEARGEQPDLQLVTP
jgi:hypothetical protein